ncbi:ABC transporter ATP-binding protein [Streptomyces sp. NPDC087300]|uniref:ABC transporter ATP-binding protein n=1 Tax=Streptomyces sp. NPDC087300 TaxID=3365780 RepID=UPI0037F9BA6B
MTGTPGISGIPGIPGTRGEPGTTRTGRARSAAPVPALLRLLPRASLPLTAVLTALALLDAALAPALMLSVGVLVGRLPDAGAGLGSAAGHGVLTAFAVLCGVYVAGLLVEPAVQTVAGRLGRRVSARTAQLLLHGSLRPAGIAALDDPSVADRLTLAQGQGTGMLPVARAVSALPALFSARAAGATSAVLLLGFHWWAPLPLLAAWTVSGVWRDREVRRAVDVQAGSTTELRRAEYLRAVALDGGAAKEIRVFGLAPWLVDRFTQAWLAGVGRLGADRRGAVARDVVAGVLLVAAHAAVLVPLAVESAHGGVGVARTTVYLQAVVGTAALGWLGDLRWTLAKASSAVPPALEVAALAERDTVVSGPLPAAGLPASGIRFEGTVFAYPGSRRPVFDALDLWLPAGGSLAVVGANGAGKTTLVKLLARLYDPTAGRVTVDGTDLRDLDVAAWRHQLAVVFQDFVRYELAARDNVGFGAVRAPQDDEALARAARLAGLDPALAALPNGWDTPLSRRFTDGTDLSGGQWQRLALARALYAVEHGARVLVLDEPTAHLDVRAEADLYERFLDLTRGLTTVLISHRFATVRLADRICYVEGGRVVEQGAHDELIAQDGRYARAFALQSAAYAGGTHA